MLVVATNWSEVTAIATAILALSLVGAIGAAVFAAQQVREARTSREAQTAIELFRRWNDESMVESRRLVDRFKSPEELRESFTGWVASGAPEAYVAYRELDYFEQVAMLERQGAFDLELIRLLMYPTLIDRWEMWRPALHEAHGPGVYPLFEGLVEKLKRRVG